MRLCAKNGGIGQRKFWNYSFFVGIFFSECGLIGFVGFFLIQQLQSIHIQKNVVYAIYKTTI
ncbi:MAG: hypothetical protein RIS64_2050 [Bacteroidota bacterium]|jgi:hypothetical protein